MKRQAAILAVLLLAGLLLTGCDWQVSVEDAKAQRLRAEADLEQTKAEAYEAKKMAEAEAYAAKVAANTQASNDALARTTAGLPYVIAIGGGVLLVLFGGLLFWQMAMDRQAARQWQPHPPAQGQALPPPAINVFVLTPGDGPRRVDTWRQLEAEAKRQGLASGAREVTIYQDDRQRL